jgi:hypothetical protein
VTEKDWDRLFELIDKVVQMPVPGGSWQDKAETVRAEAIQRDAETNLEEFAGWFVG